MKKTVISKLKRIGFILLLAIIIAMGFNETKACSCLPSSISDSIKDSDAVFVGQVTQEIKPRRKWQIKVSKVIKGEVIETVNVVAAMVGTSCEISNFKLNEEYLFFADEIKDEKYIFYPRVCSWTTNIASLNSRYTDKRWRDWLEKEKPNMTEEAYKKKLEDVEEFEKSFDQTNKELLEAIKKGKEPKKTKE